MQRRQREAAGRVPPLPCQREAAPPSAASGP